MPLLGSVITGVLISVMLTQPLAFAGNCLVQGNRKIGDCENVHIGPAKPLTIQKSASFNGNYGEVTVKRNVVAHVSGNTGRITVESGAELYFSGNADDVVVFGVADIDGNTGWVTVKKGGRVVIRGIVSGASGQGSIVRAKGAIIGGKYIQ